MYLSTVYLRIAGQRLNYVLIEKKKLLFQVQKLSPTFLHHHRPLLHVSFIPPYTVEYSLTCLLWSLFVPRTHIREHVQTSYFCLWKFNQTLVRGTVKKVEIIYICFFIIIVVIFINLVASIVFVVSNVIRITYTYTRIYIYIYI